MEWETREECLQTEREANARCLCRVLSRLTENVEERVTQGDLQRVLQFLGSSGGECSHDARDGRADVRTQRERVDTIESDDSHANERSQR